MGDKKKVSSKLLLLGGIRKFAMPSRSFSLGTVNVSSNIYVILTYGFFILHLTQIYSITISIEYYYL